MIACCVWRATEELIVALDTRFGEPLDTYVNGSQVWLRDDGPGGAALEWRLHPVAGYRRPVGLSTEEVFSTVALALALSGASVDADRHEAGLPVPLERLWDGLEAFCAYGDDVEPQPLASAATHSLGIAPDAFGLVDHEGIGDRWERARGAISIVNELLGQLGRS